MEPAEIGIVLATSSDLVARINDAILRTSAREQAEEQAADTPEISSNPSFGDEVIDVVAKHDSPTVQKLRAVRDALLALEDHLDALQALQKQQKAERDELLVVLEESRKILIEKLREYEGGEWELIQEAHAFAGEPVQRKDDLVLPPYQSAVPDISLLGKNLHFSALQRRSLDKPGEDYSRSDSLVNKLGKEGESNELMQLETAPEQDAGEVALGSRKLSGFGVRIANFISRFGRAVGLTAKSGLVIASVIAIITFVGLEPQLRKKSAERASKLQNFVEGENHQDERPSSLTSCPPLVQDEFCPAGKVLLVQDGVKKCFVKERIEVPFKEIVKQPDASYGFG